MVIFKDWFVLTILRLLTSCTNSVGRLEKTRNSSISEIVRWSASNKLSINKGKGKTIVSLGSVSRKRSMIKLVHSVILLRLEIVSELSFTSQVEKLCKTLSQRIGIMRKMDHTCPRDKGYCITSNSGQYSCPRSVYCQSIVFLLVV